MDSADELQGLSRYDFRAETAMAVLDPDLTLAAALENLWICILVTRSGRAVVGYSSCELAQPLDGERGRRLAHEDALRLLRHPRPTMISSSSEPCSEIAILKLGSVTKGA